MVRIPRSTISFANSVAFIGVTSSHPSIATCPSFASIPSTIFSAPNFSIAALTKLGSLIAILPRMTRLTPQASLSSIAFNVRIPPPNCTGIDTASIICLITTSLTPLPSFAPSKSIRCK